MEVTDIDLSKRAADEVPTPPSAGDSPSAQAPPAAKAGSGELQPILPAWVRDRRQLIDTTLKAVQRAAHRSTWHGVRAPIYAGRLISMAPRGAWRIGRAVWEVLSDGQGHGLRVTAATSGNPDVWLKLRKERNERIHRRLVVAGTLGAPIALCVLAVLSIHALGAVVGLALGMAFVRTLPGPVGLVIGLAGPVAGWLGLPYVVPPVPIPPWWVLAIGVAGLVGVLGYVGRPLGKPLVKPATVLVGNHGPLRAPFVLEALCSLGIGGLNDKTMDQIGLLMDVARHGPGYQVDMELPRGVAATEVIDRREKLSAALRRELGCVWPSVGKRHEGHLSLYVCDQPMNASRQAPWPLLKAGQVDLFQPVPVATDQMGAWVTMTIAYANGVIGAVPRQGKTFFLRELLLIAGLDPRARVYAFDGKGTGDLSPCSLFAHYVGVGDEDDEIKEQLEVVRGLRVELRRRARVIRGLPRAECPESKVTSALANRRDLGLEPIVVGVDETQVWFQYGDKSNNNHKKIRDEFASCITDLVKRGPALGIWVFLATQQVNADTIPTSISNNAVIRFCLKVFGVTANDQVLGTGARKAGVDATMFSTEDRGIGYLRADGADARIVRTVHGLDAVASEKVAARARALRVAAGRLTGQAADEIMESEVEQVVLLDDCRQVLDAGRTTRVHLGELRDMLAQLRPGTWGHLDNDALAAMLRQSGVTPATVWSSAAKRDGWGVKREWLDVSTTEVIGSPDAT